MSYKHNNLMAMRQNYWNDEHSSIVSQEKQFLLKTIVEENIFENASIEDAKYIFFNLPSIIIVKGYALGFTNSSVVEMILKYLSENRTELKSKSPLKIKYRL